MKDNNKVIGVMTPYFGSFYFSTLMIAIHDAALKVGAGLIIIRTSNIDPEDLLANDNVIGWILIQNAVSINYAAKLAASGKPIVSIGNRIPAEYGQVVTSDNERGMMQAVEHLIEHGHRRILFIGYKAQDDMTARLIGYKKALHKHGIDFNPNLVIDTVVQGNESGWIAAEKIINEELNCTAIAACTDLTAIGLIHHLQDMGFNVPHDYAVTGFDDSYDAQSNIPSITSVNQDLESFGSKAVELLMDRYNGKSPTTHIEYIPSYFKIRNSCGCNALLHESDNTDEATSRLNANEAVTVDNFELYQFLISSNKPGLEDLARLMAPYFQWGTLASRQVNPMGAITFAINQHFIFKNPDHIHDLKSISPELFPPPSFYTASEDLNIESPSITHIIPIRIGELDHSILAMVSNEDYSSSKIPYSMLVQYMDLLAFSLERKASHQELLKQTEKYRRIAEQLEVVSRTTNDGIWDWDIDSKLIECNEYFTRLIGFTDKIGASMVNVSDFKSLIHPDDMELLSDHTQNHLVDCSPFLFEFRIRHQSGGYIWLSSAGEAIRDSTGQAIRMIGSVRDISDRKRYEQQMVFLAFHDPLTGLVNRTRFYGLIKDYVNRQDSPPFALLLLDLDGFKSVNDLYGHQMGDQVLIDVATLLKETINLPDHIARFGGDEFVILLPLDSETQLINTAKIIVSRIKSSLNRNYPHVIVTGSLGISVFPADSLDPDILIKYADTAMYIAKQEEKNAYRLFHPSMLVK